MQTTCRRCLIQGSRSNQLLHSGLTPSSPGEGVSKVPFPPACTSPGARLMCGHLCFTCAQHRHTPTDMYAPMCPEAAAGCSQASAWRWPSAPWRMRACSCPSWPSRSLAAAPGRMTWRWFGTWPACSPWCASVKLWVLSPSSGGSWHRGMTTWGCWRMPSPAACAIATP
jgi:hypothetical protein